MECTRNIGLSMKDCERRIHEVTEKFNKTYQWTAKEKEKLVHFETGECNIWVQNMTLEFQLKLEALKRDTETKINELKQGKDKTVHKVMQDRDTKIHDLSQGYEEGMAQSDTGKKQGIGGTTIPTQQFAKGTEAQNRGTESQNPRSYQGLQCTAG